jgi:regulator of nonsense transcripts 1
MDTAFTHLGNHLISDSASTINAGDDLSTIDPDESLLDGEYGRSDLPGGPWRRRHDDDEGTEVFDDDDTESLASVAVDGARVRGAASKPEEEKELPAHACA